MGSQEGASIPCTHCGLPVPSGLLRAEDDRQFCCGGCRLAWEVIHEHGLDGYYSLKRRVGAPSQPANPSRRGYEDFDDPGFAGLYWRDAGRGLQRVELYLEGVHCAACVWLVERTPALIDGVAECRLDLGRSMATVEWDPAAVELSQVARFLDSVGYPVHPYHGVEARQMAIREDRALLIRLAVAGAVAGNVMLIAFALYGGALHGIAAEHERFFRWVSLVLSLPSVLWCAWVFHRGALGALRARRVHMDVPISLGIVAGFVWGIHNTLRGTGEVYFDSVTVLIFLLLVGRWLQRRQQRHAARATELLYSLTPAWVRLVEVDGVREVPLASLAPGAVVELRSGDTVPADGVVESGRSSLDLALLSGESRPVEVAPGDPVHAGTVNLTALLHVRIAATGADTRLGRLMELIEEGARRRAPVTLLADRLSAWFVSAVLILAAVTAAIWWQVDPGRAVDHAIALLIVSCPCALGLATPLAVAAAIGRAAGIGILVKGGDALEGLARPGSMLLDKTGTLSEGRLRLIRWWGDDALKGAVAAVEASSNHPIARSLAGAAVADPAWLDAEIHHLQGRGLIATTVDARLLVGSPFFVGEELGELSPPAAAAVAQMVGDGLTPVVASANAQLAVCGLGDPLRPEAPAVIAELHRNGWQVEIVSGDHPRLVTTVAAQVGIDKAAAHGGVAPEGKVAAVEEALTRGPVVMVGDGVNDAAALATATVGVGMHGGAEATLMVADVYLSTSGLRPLAALLRGARRTLAIIRRNLILSLSYNVVAVSLSMAGFMHPLLAAVLMPLSSATVVFSSYRSRSFCATDLEPDSIATPEDV